MSFLRPLPQQSLIIAGLSTLIVSGSVMPTIAGECLLTNVVGVNLGAYDVFSPAPTDSVGSITYRCSNLGGTPVLIELSRGNSPTYLSRQLSQGSATTLNYNLYLDAARTSVWGNGTEGSSPYGPVFPADNTDTTVYVYGRIPAQQNAPVGSYSDTVTISINF